jgi:hypothetical protein
MPKLANIDTNLIIYTKSGNTYNFYLYSTDEEDIRPPITNLIFYKNKNKKYTKREVKYKNNLKDNKYLIKKILQLEREIREKMEFAKFDIANINFSYTHNDDNILLMGNDEMNTYIKLKENTSIPQIYYLNNKENTFSTPLVLRHKNVIKIAKIAKVWEFQYHHNNDCSFLWWYCEKSTKYTIEKNDTIYDIKKSKYHKKYMKSFNDIAKDYRQCTNVDTTEDTAISYNNFNDIGIYTIFNDDKFIYIKTKNGSDILRVYQVKNRAEILAQTQIINDLIIVKSLGNKYKIINSTIDKDLCIEKYQ